MNISSVSGSGSVSYTSTASSDTSSLEKQKTKLEADLQKLESSKDDDKTKEAKKKQIEQQIKSIEAQIARKSNNESNVISGSAAAPANPPIKSNVLTPASTKEIAAATTNSEGRFDIRI